MDSDKMDISSSDDRSIDQDKNGIGLDLNFDCDENIQCMEVSDVTLISLNVISETKDLGGSHSSSEARTLFDVFNKRCKTKSGPKLLNHWLTHPLVDPTRIETRLNLVQFFVQHVDYQQEIVLNYLPTLEMHKMSNKFAKKSATLSELEQFFQTLHQLDRLIIFLADVDDECVQRNYLNMFRSFQQKLQPYKKLIENSIEPDTLGTGDPMMSHNLNDDLDNLHRKIRSTIAKAERIVENVEQDVDACGAIKLDREAETGFKMRISLKMEHKIRGQKALHVLGSKTSGVSFTNDQLVRLSLDYVQFRQDVQILEAELLKDLLQKVSIYSRPMEGLSRLYSHLDVILSFSLVASSCEGISQSFVRPTILPMGSGKIHLHELRHPLLERRSDVQYVSNSIHFDQDGKRFYLITGPNMGGKSTFIRSVGLAVLMTQIGSFVPASKAVVSILDGLFTRVGASDQQCKGLSTFMAEMMDASTMLSKATQNSLVIIDELGRGTSTFDGFGLAWSISEELLNVKRCYTLFATHFHELTNLAKESCHVDNLMVTYLPQMEQGNIQMLYQLKQGVCDQKFGLQVAKMVGFPEEIVKDASEKISEFENIYEDKTMKKMDLIGKTIAEFTQDLPPIDQMDDQELEKHTEALKSVLIGQFF